jgi:galactokinase/mevalonate kinase-like predicted kinase
MSISLSVPSRINILGNPADGNEGDFATISMAVDVRARATLQLAEKFIFEISDVPAVIFPLSRQRLPLDGSHDLLISAFNRLLDFSQEFREKCIDRGFKLRVSSSVPRQSGLGGSSLFVVLTLAALREHYHLDPQRHNNYIIAELTQRVEARDLGITAGFADRYVPLFGGLAYIDFRGKLFQNEIGAEPLATYERLDELVPRLNLVVVSTGITHNSGDVHGRMRPLFLQEFDRWHRSAGKMPPMVEFMSSAWDCAWRGKIALLEGDLNTFGHLMNRNHQIVDAMMRYCGFEDGAGRINNLFIDEAHKHGALGAKLTGAGGGGSVFALVSPGNEEKLISAWQKTAAKNYLTEIKFYRIDTPAEGLRFETSLK